MFISDIIAALFANSDTIICGITTRKRHFAAPFKDSDIIIHW